MKIFSFVSSAPYYAARTPGRGMAMAKRVIVLGGGVAGMSAAHELAERDFDVTVYETRPIPGGKARSMPVPGSGSRWAPRPAGRARLPLLPRLLPPPAAHDAPHPLPRPARGRVLATWSAPSACRWCATAAPRWWRRRTSPARSPTCTWPSARCSPSPPTWASRWPSSSTSPTACCSCSPAATSAASRSSSSRPGGSSPAPARARRPTASSWPTASRARSWRPRRAR